MRQPVPRPLAACRRCRSADCSGLPAALPGSADVSCRAAQRLTVVVLGEAVALAANIGMYFIAFRVLTPKVVPTRKLVPGAVAAGAGWTVLQAVGAYLLHHFLRGDSVYGVFATVLGLLAWIYLAVEITLYGAEINVVLARQLWPRSIVQPPLTEADRAVLAAQARPNQRRDDQHVEVSFDDQPPDAGASGRPPRAPDEIAPRRRSRAGDGSD